MKKLYFLALLCCFSFAAFAQSATVILWANTNGPNSTGSTTTSTITPGSIVTGNSDVSRGYAVFDLSPIPAGSVIMSVSSGADVAAYTPGGPPFVPDFLWNVNGFSGDITSILIPASLYSDLEIPPGTGFVLWGNPFGPGAGDYVFPSPGAGGNAVTLVQDNVMVGPVGKISLSYVTTNITTPAGSATTGTYTITGESGLAGTAADTAAVGHAPYLVITYCPQPTAVVATPPTGTLCAELPVTFTGSATGATGYSWSGPGSFTSTDQNPTFTATAASSGVYTLTAINTCGTYSATATVTSPLVTVAGGPISGITNVWVGFTTQLGNPTPGGTWTSSNTAIATVDGTGLVTGNLPGTVTITYTTISGCIYTTSVLVEATLFSQIPTVSGGSGGLGFPLVAWYPFCGDTTDRDQIVGVGPNPLINNGAGIVPATLTTDRFGISADAYLFDGVDNVMYTPTFYPVTTPTLDYTYSCWMEADTAENSIIVYNGNPNLNGFGFVMNNGVGQFGSGPGADVAVLFGGVSQFLPTPVSLNRWHNLVLKKNGNSYDFYIDDISVGFVLTGFNAMTSVFQVGGDYSSTPSSGGPGPLARGFRGRIDDIAIYNRQLSDGERDSLFNFNPDARPFSLGNDTTICSDSITLFPTPPSTGDYYQWMYFVPSLGSYDTVYHPGTVIPVTDSIVSVYPNQGITGNKYALAVGKPFGCYAYDTITVYRTPLPINIGVSPLDICLGDTVTLTDIIPHSSASSFVWSTGDTSNSIRVYSAGSYSVTLDSFNHFTRTIGGVIHNDSVLCRGTDTVVVKTFAVPIIGLPATYTNCQGVPDTLRPYADSVYTYSWGYIGTAPISSGDTLVANLLGLTTYWLKVTDIGCVGCTGVVGCPVYDTISVFIAFDTLTFYARDTAICYGQVLVTSSTQELVTDNHIATYQWTPTAGISISNVPNPDISPDTSAEYILTVSYARCPDIVDSFYLDVQPIPVIFPGNNRSVCQFDTIHVSAGATPAWYTHYNYSWSPSTELDASTTSTVVFTPIDTGQVSLVISVTTSAGCSALDSVQLFVHPGNFLLDSSIRIACPGDSIQLSPYTELPGVVLSSFSWYPSTYLSDSTSSAPWVKAATSLSYRLIAASQYGCTDTINYGITVPPGAVIDLGADSVTIYTGESYVIPTQTNCTYFTWFPNLQIDNIHGQSPIVNPNVNTTYIVTASTENGCVVVDSIKVKLSPKTSIDIPNAFTPGAGTNNTFMVLSTGEVALSYFRIYNRWGNMVFETKNIQQGWDGTFNGKPQPQGVYVYEIQAEASNGEIFQKQGNVTLLR